MSWPEYTLLALLAIGLGINLARDGESRAGERYSFWTALLSNGLVVWLLYMGGFFA